MAGLVEKQMRGDGQQQSPSKNQRRQEQQGGNQQSSNSQRGSRQGASKAPAARQGKQAGGRDTGDQQGDFGEEATAEEQEQYERVVLAGMKLIYDDASHPGLMDTLRNGADNPTDTMAQSTMDIMNRIVEEMQGDLMGPVVLPAASAILEEVGTLADTAGIFPVDEAQINAAAQKMLMMAGQQFGVDPAAVEEMMATMDPEQLEQAVSQQAQYAQAAQGGGPGPAQATGGGASQARGSGSAGQRSAGDGGNTRAGPRGGSTNRKRQARASA